MRERPSLTAAWVALSRMLGASLPPEAQLVLDPHAEGFLGWPGALLARRGRWAPPPLRAFVLYMQARTRAIDDALATFARQGGRQVLLLGAGYDARAARFVRALEGGHVFEVDHPATQARKRAALARTRPASAPVTYLPWDFEQRSPAGLPEALAAAGHDPAAPTLTIWEGVTMYLTEPAVDACVTAVRDLSAPGSPFVLTYVDRAWLDRPRGARALVSRLVALGGEPFRFGWRPAEVPAWFAARGFDVERDRTMADVARALLPPAYARRVDAHERALVLVRREEAM